ncbi:helix-turn-helix domain-containing protein [Micromonospora sp. NPDC023888]|uniref:helix-turn-helix domain-containing protein n=1 Tax=Micromonospora sp. NPDC023888 TaxID=3155607 RepID=UPI0033ED7964
MGLPPLREPGGSRSRVFDGGRDAVGGGRAELSFGDPQGQIQPRRERTRGDAVTVGGEDAEMAAVTTWATANLHLPITVADLARQGLQSTRTLHRNFRHRFGLSPQAWLTEQRLRAACGLLEGDDITIDEVARRTGLGTATNLRAHFRRAFATTPTAYRRAFTP